MRYSRWSAALGVPVAAVLGVAVVGPVDARQGWASGAAGPAPVHVAMPVTEPPAPRSALLHLVASIRRGYHDGRFTGPAFSAYYGWVQVQVVVTGGKLAAVNVLRYPSDRVTSRRIAHRALPLLEREVIRAQSARVHAVSGATLTSRAFLRSVSVALRRASG
ncbi:MAG: FMN-binding protein [Rhodospirillales bacterium]|nr:FMN-binding protein [Rhodospirillales bacterium]MDE2199360.1 FMN-binding protein [Rhodospirillales bacterium]MDE2574050.1 FMN-binding protein [Rhodospirillales bacterium]